LDGRGPRGIYRIIRLSGALHGALGSYLRDTLQEGSACLRVPRAQELPARNATTGRNTTAQQRGSSLDDTLRPSNECESSPEYPHARHRQSRAGQRLSMSTFAGTGEGSGVRACPLGRQERWWKVLRSATYRLTSVRRELQNRMARTACARKAVVRRLVKAG